MCEIRGTLLKQYLVIELWVLELVHVPESGKTHTECTSDWHCKKKKKKKRDTYLNNFAQYFHQYGTSTLYTVHDYMYRLACIVSYTYMYSMCTFAHAYMYTCTCTDLILAVC